MPLSDVFGSIFRFCLPRLLPLLFLVVASDCFALKRLPVLAVEYPPFVTSASVDGGTVMRLLRQRLAGSEFIIKPDFFPPGRASLLMARGNWCASLYPPPKAWPDAVPVSLREGTVDLGLYRYRQSTPFRWRSYKDLAGKRVAMIRRSGTQRPFVTAMEDAGLTVMRVESVKQGIRLLDKKRVDYAFSDQPSARQAMKALGIPQTRLQFSETLILSVPYRVYINHNCKTGMEAARIIRASDLSEPNRHVPSPGIIR